VLVAIRCELINIQYSDKSLRVLVTTPPRKFDALILQPFQLLRVFCSREYTDTHASLGLYYDHQRERQYHYIHYSKRNDNNQILIITYY
jgi:hypothetical protein